MGNPKDRYINIVATADASAPHGVSFAMEENGVNVTTLLFDKTADKMKKWDEYHVHFHLVNQPGVDLWFTDNLDNAMWAYSDTAAPPPCPPPPGSSMKNEFDVINLDKDQMTLNVRNKDTNREWLTFCFNFLPNGQKDDPTQYVPYDPIGQNTDGGSRFSSATLITAAVAAVAVVAVVAIVGTKYL